MAEKGGESKRWNAYFDFTRCPVCRGERLKEQSRRVTVHGKRLPEISLLSQKEIHEWISGLAQELSDEEAFQCGNLFGGLSWQRNC